MTSQDFEAGQVQPDKPAEDPDLIRSGDGSAPAEDDALLRRPSDEAAGDPDVERPDDPDDTGT